MHRLNLATGVIAEIVVCDIWFRCNTALFLCTCVVFCTTVLFHGSHAFGYAELADRVFMKYDILAVVVAGGTMLIEAPSNTLHVVFGVESFIFGVWMITWHPDFPTGPFNLVASLVHGGGFLLNLYMSRLMCESAN